MSTIKPTVGRIVYYYEAKASSGPAGAPAVLVTGPLAATVTAVHGETCVNVAVNNADGAGAFGRTSIRLLQPGEHRPELGQWVEWMPYQIAQIAQNVASEALSKAADAMVSMGMINAGSNAPTCEERQIGSVTTGRVLSKEEHDLYREIRLVAEALESGCGVKAAQKRLFDIAIADR